MRAPPPALRPLDATHETGIEGEVSLSRPEQPQPQECPGSLTLQRARRRVRGRTRPRSLSGRPGLGPPCVAAQWHPQPALYASSAADRKEGPCNASVCRWRSAKTCCRAPVAGPWQGWGPRRKGSRPARRVECSPAATAACTEDLFWSTSGLRGSQVGAWPPAFNGRVGALMFAGQCLGAAQEIFSTLSPSRGRWPHPVSALARTTNQRASSHSTPTRLRHPGLMQL
jgi:hypothetical protein